MSWFYITDCTHVRANHIEKFPFTDAYCHIYNQIAWFRLGANLDHKSNDIRFQLKTIISLLMSKTIERQFSSDSITMSV